MSTEGDPVGETRDGESREGETREGESREGETPGGETRESETTGDRGERGRPDDGEGESTRNGTDRAGDGRGTGDYPAPGGPDGGHGAEGDGEGEESTDPWYADRRARTLVAVDLVATLAVVAGTTELLDDALGLVRLDATPLAVTVPWYVYVFATLGALGYVFTMLICYDADPRNVFHANLRVPAALPLAAGIYLLVVQLLGEVPTTRLLAGLAFVTGLYVNRAYERIGDLADRLLSIGGSGTDARPLAGGDEGRAGGSSAGGGSRSAATADSGD